MFLRVYCARGANGRLYLVCYGPFASQASAQAYINALAFPGDNYVLPVFQVNPNTARVQAAVQTGQRVAVVIPQGSNTPSGTYGPFATVEDGEDWIATSPLASQPNLYIRSVRAP